MPPPAEVCAHRVPPIQNIEKIGSHLRLDLYNVQVYATAQKQVAVLPPKIIRNGSTCWWDSGIGMDIPR